MRIFTIFVVVFLLTSMNLGCGGEPKGGLTGVTTVESLSGQVVQDGQPIQLPDGSGVTLQLLNNNNPAHSLNVLLKSDGSFSLGKVAAGEYKACLEIPHNAGPKGKGAAPNKHFLKDMVMVEPGKSNGIKIEAGKDWKHP